jgi:hypothetical protein
VPTSINGAMVLAHPIGVPKGQMPAGEALILMRSAHMNLCLCDILGAEAYINGNVGTGTRGGMAWNGELRETIEMVAPRPGAAEPQPEGWGE